MARIVQLAAAAVWLVGIACSAPVGSRSAESAAVPGYRVVRDVQLPGDTSRWDYQVYDPVSHRLYIAHLGASQVVVFDARRHWYDPACVVNPCSVTSSGRPAVLVEDPAKPIAALDPPGPQWGRVGRLRGSALLDPLVRPSVIVVINVLSQHLLQVPAAKDQHAVQHLSPGRAHPALRKCVRHWPPVGQADDLHALTLEDLVECAREL